MTRICSGCTKVLGPKNVSGLCRSCVAKRHNADPAIRARQAAGITAHFARPGVKEAYARRIAIALANESPEARERRREHGRRVAAANLHAPEVKARANAPEVKAANGRKRTETVLGWCPPEYRDRYRFLKATKLLRAAEARKLTEEEIAADTARRHAAMTPFERQMERVRKGARLIEKPVFRRADHSFTLGGVAPEAM